MNNFIKIIILLSVSFNINAELLDSQSWYYIHADDGTYENFGTSLPTAQTNVIATYETDINLSHFCPVNNFVYQSWGSLPTTTIDADLPENEGTLTVNQAFSDGDSFSNPVPCDSATAYFGVVRLKQFDCGTGQYDTDENKCVVETSCDELSGTNAVPIGWINFGTNPSNTLSNHTSCINGCTVFYEGHNEPQAEVIIESVSNYYGLGLYTYQLESEECNSGLNTTILNIEAEPTPSCAPGDDPTLINGLFACENNGIEVETEQPETETTTTDIVDNGDGTTTETQVTTNSNTGVITTTVIDTTTATGESTTTTTVTNDNSNFNYQSENQSDFCANNPNATICQTNQVSNTSCGTTPTCSGDAIQCAILIQAHEKNCEGENFVDAVATTAQENAILAGVGGDNDLDTFAAGTNVDLSDPLNGYVPNVTAACPPDILINTTRGQITVPMSYFCDLTDLLRPIVLILAYITAAMIFYNGLIREA